MPSLIVTPLYAALLALLAQGLAVLVIRHRRAGRIAFGTGGSDELERTVRAHGNCVEQCGLALILLALLEINGGNAYVLHGAALMLVVGRFVHAAALVRGTKGRVPGMALTFTSYLVLIPANVIAALG